MYAARAGCDGTCLNCRNHVSVSCQGGGFWAFEVGFAMDEVRTAVDHLIKIVDDGAHAGLGAFGLVEFLRSYGAIKNTMAVVDRAAIQGGGHDVRHGSVEPTPESGARCTPPDRMTGSLWGGREELADYGLARYSAAAIAR